jgi:hypothetical protein|tara:strand:- start:22998 stop:24248 length:1251 start_codon:yes stop_codon:yes gene_type:complete
MWNKTYCLVKSNNYYFLVLFFGLFFANHMSVSAQEVKKENVSKQFLRGSISADYSYFNKTPFKQNQLSQYLSLLITGEYKYVKGKFKFTAEPYLRLDAIDTYRSHLDMRNLYLTYWNKNISVNAGMRLYTLGKFTGFSLVDILNRIDEKESILDFKKLGQPSIDIKYLRKSFTFEIYFMPYLRSVNFNADKSRLLLIPFEIDNNAKIFESKHKEYFPNIASRIGYKNNNTEIVLGYYHGYNKNPDIIYQPANQTFTEFYPIMSQWSLEWQSIYKGITFTSELINQTYKGNKNYFGLHVALGYDISKHYQGSSTMNISIEYINDKYRISRNAPFGNNFITLYRLNLGDINSTVFSAKVFSNQDLKYHFFDVNLTRRVLNEFKITGKFSFSSGRIEEDNPLYLNDFNTYSGIKIDWFF